MNRAFRTWHPWPHLGDLRRVLQFGLPSGAQAALETATWGIGLSALIANFGTAHQAAATVLVLCMQVSFLLGEGLGVASLSMTGDAVGAGRFDLAQSRARRGFWPPRRS